MSIIISRAPTLLRCSGLFRTPPCDSYRSHLVTADVDVLDDDRYDRDRSGRRDGRDSRKGPPAAGPTNPQDDRRNLGREREGYQNVPTGPRADRNKTMPGGAGSASGNYTAAGSMLPPVSTSSSQAGNVAESAISAATPYVPPMTENDLTAIRSRYLGVDKKKRKIRKMNDRKFVFDWDAQDDTFAEDSPVAVGSNRQGAQVMFGRGHLAGMDDGPTPGERRPGVGPQLADDRERRRAVKSGLDERHWSEKSLEEMKERDWRIFREDFSISARGVHLLIVHDPIPLRLIQPI